MVAIRGAISIEADTKEQIEVRSLELYSEMLRQNNLKASDIIYIHTTTTSDITEYYPATALRLSGCGAPLFSSLEPPIKGSMPLCIRFLVLAGTNQQPRHVYLGKAAQLIGKNLTAGVQKDENSY